MRQYFLLASLCISTCTYAQLYDIVELKPKPGDFETFANDINASGVVAGASSLNASPQAGIWTNGVFSNMANEVSPVTALGMNDAGDLFGYTYGNRAFIYHASTGTASTIDPTGIYTGSFGEDINNLGVGVGYFTSSVPGQLNRAVIYTISGPMVLGTLGGDSSYGNGINDSGQISGWSTLGNSTYRAIRATTSTMTQLNPIAGFNASVGNGINNAGVVAGTSFESGTFNERATTWNGTTATGYSLVSGYTGARALAINDFGTVVGVSFVNGSNSRATLFTADGSFLVQNMLTDNTGWTLYSANAVNGDGWITGDALHNGQRVSYIARPVPEPTTIACLAAGLLSLRRQCRRLETRTRSPKIH